jgi:hypothetical protein
MLIGVFLPTKEYGPLDATVARGAVGVRRDVSDLASVRASAARIRCA